MTELASMYGPVSGDISRVGERLRGLSLGRHELLGETLQHLFSTGGKWMRPALVLLSGKLGRYDVDRLVTLAASLEVVHTATLVHDDTIDEALTRRGIPTISAIWDSKVAILIGDFLLAQSAELASQLDSVRIMKLLADTVMAMSSGELRQYAATRSRAVDEADYIQRIAGKTASLFAMCCEGGAVVSGQSEEHIAALRDYGMNLGLAFQIADDVLDFEGTNESLGKPAGNDLLQGTVTLPVILLYERLPASSPMRDAIRDGSDVPGVIDAVRSSDVLSASLARARGYAAEACRSLAIFPDSPARDALLALTEQATARSN